MVHKVTLFPLSGIESFDDVIITASDGDIKLEPSAGSEILLDDTIHIDAGVVTGATSITSTSFVGTLSTATQPNIESIGTAGDTLSILSDRFRMVNSSNFYPAIDLFSTAQQRSLKESPSR